MENRTVHTFGGVNLDIDPRAIKESELTYANDNDVLGLVSGRDTSTYPLPSSEFSYEVDSLQTQYQYVRAKYRTAATAYALRIIDSAGNTITGSGFIATGANLAAFIADINSTLNPFGYTVEGISPQGDWFAFAMYQTSGSTPVGYTLIQVEVIGGETREVPIYTLQDWFNPLGAVDSQFTVLQTSTFNQNQIVFSQSAYAGAIGYASKDLSGNWTYTHLIVSRNLTFPSDEVIEVQIEQTGFNQVAVYWTANDIPRIFYIPIDFSSPLKYNMTNVGTKTSGLMSLERSINDQTTLQIKNPARISFSSQEEAGGSLESGTWFYYVQCGINNTYSEWSPASEPIMVSSFGTSGQSSGVVFRGNQTPQITSKSNILRIFGVDTRIYDSVRVGAALNQGGSISGIIVGEYNTENFDQFFITHSGREASIETYDRNLFPPVQEVYTRARNIQVKKNRLNLADVDVQTNTDLTEVFQNVVLGQTRYEMDGVGIVDFNSNNLIRASVPTGGTELSLGAGGTQSVPASNVSPPNVSGAGYNPANTDWVVPSTGSYNLAYQLSFIFRSNNPSGSALNLVDPKDYAIDVFYLNVTTGERYCVLNDVRKRPNTLFGAFKGGEINVDVQAEQAVSLTAGHVISLKFTCTSVPSPALNNFIYFKPSTTLFVTQPVSQFSTKNITIGEYQLPENVSKYTGYMVNETYAFFARVLYKSGFTSDWHHIGNYTFNNGGVPYADLPSAYLSTDGFIQTASTYSYGLTISGIDITSIKDDIVRIEIGRAITNPTVLGSGVFIASDANSGASGGTFTAGLYTGNTDVANTYGSTHNALDPDRYFGIMLCPDWINGQKPEYQNGDKLIVYGVAGSITNSAPIIGGTGKWGSYRQFSGAYSPYTGSPLEIDVLDGEYVPFNTESRVLMNDNANLYYRYKPNNNGSIPSMATEGMAMTLESRINRITGGVSVADDYGVYYVQYLRPIENQYVIKDVTVVPCNHYIDVVADTNPILPLREVFGGDTYTQRTYLKVLYNASNPDTTKQGFLTSFISFYSQNKINQQLRFTDSTFRNLPFPMGNTLDNYLFGNYEAMEQFQIDKGYDWYNPLSNGLVYNPDKNIPNNFIARIWYSLQKPANSLIDFYRTILPNDFKDLPVADGNIVGLYDSSDVMIAIQPRKVSVMPYQSDVILSGSDGSLYVGNGGVYAQREIPVSNYGTSLKSATLKAMNRAGNTQIYWYSDYAKSLMRHGGDGIKPLSWDNGWRTYFEQSTGLIKNEFDVSIRLRYIQVGDILIL